MDLAFFFASKLLSFVVQPLNYVLVMLLGATLAMRKGRIVLARRLGIAALALLAFIGVTLFPNLVLRALEDRHATRPVDIGAFRGLIVLGGAVRGGPAPIEREDTMLNGAAERLTKSLELARLYPHLRIIYTGTSGRIFAAGKDPAAAAREFYLKQGLAEQRLIIESRSRNTYENAILAARVHGIRISDPWLLVTSAAHMPRSLLVFQKAGWNVAPYATDFETGRTLNILDYSLAEGAGRWQGALHELAGLVVYRLTGKI